MQPANIAGIYFHSLWQAPTPQRRKNPYFCFHWSKISFTICDWSDAHSHLWEKPTSLSEFAQFYYKSFFFKLASSKSHYLLHRYWWNTRIFPVTEKIISSSRAVKILFLSFTCEDISVAMVTNMISQLQETFPLRHAADSFEISFTKRLGGEETGQLCTSQCKPPHPPGDKRSLLKLRNAPHPKVRFFL